MRLCKIQWGMYVSLLNSYSEQMCELLYLSLLQTLRFPQEDDS